MISLFGFPNRADEGTLSGGGWATGLPLSNMQHRRVSRVARSTNATATNTQFQVDLGQSRPIRIISLTGHNLSATAQVRFRAPGTGTTYDSGFIDAHPTAYPTSATLWGEDRGGEKLSSEDLDSGAPSDVIHLISAHQTEQVWSVEISDGGNADGYVEVGRLVVAPALAMPKGMAAGVELGWETSTFTEETDGGAWHHDERPRRRRASFSLNLVSRDDALVGPYELLRRAGTAKQLYFVYSDEDSIHMRRRSFLATMRELPMLRVPTLPEYHRVAMEVREEL